MNRTHRFRALRRQGSLKGLRAFEAVVRVGSFAAAAEELGVTASAVSHAVSGLETELGTALFVRRNRGAFVTDVGRSLAGTVERAFASIDRHMIDIAESGRAETLSVQSSPSFAAMRLMPRLGEFLSLRPDIDVRVWATPEPPRFEEGRIDLAISYGKIDRPGIVNTRLAMELYVPMCSPRLLPPGDRGVPAESLSGQTLIHSERSFVTWQAWADRHRAPPPDLERGLRFDRSFMALEAATAGLGIALDSDLLAHDLLARGLLVLPLGRRGIATATHFLSVPAVRADRPKTRAFIAWLESILAGGPGLRATPSPATMAPPNKGGLPEGETR